MNSTPPAAAHCALAKASNEAWPTPPSSSRRAQSSTAPAAGIGAADTQWSSDRPGSSTTPLPRRAVDSATATQPDVPR